jgi:hypothetical protein
MAKLTESYLRGMIKQVMNEMYDDSPAALGNAADEYSMGGFDSIEETAKRLGVDPMKLKAFVEAEQAGASAMYDEMGDDPNDYIAESRRRKLAESFGPPGSSDKPKKRMENTSLVYKRAKIKIESGKPLSPAEKKAVIELLNEYIEDYSGGPDYGF